MPYEFELMKLVICAPANASQDAKVKLEVVDGGEHVTLWEDQTKTTPIQLPQDFSLDELSPSKTLWVEATAPSQQLGDIKICAKLVDSVKPSDSDTCKDMVIATAMWAKFVKMWETKNKANQIYNPILKDENPPIPLKNKLYLVEDPADSRYHVTLEVEVTPAEIPTAFKNKLMYAVFRDNSKLEGSDGSFLATNPADIDFDHQGTGLTDFTIRVGYDANANSLLDETEIIKLSVVQFKLSGQSLENLIGDLKNKGIPDELLDDLQHTMEGHGGFKEEDQLLNAVKLCIGEEYTAKYKELILQHAVLDKSIPEEPIVRGTSEEEDQEARVYIDDAVN